ncbi:PAS domain S-box protein [Candidatus Chlorohelix sp.]|uniref:PAS domain S-box protein n=1 Tax=Candidatus Chlorohelix sp. TaxID=3139201 RepID=UPI003069F1B8
MDADVLSDSCKILIIENSSEDRAIVKGYLSQDRNRTYLFEESEHGKTGLELCLTGQPDLILLEFRLPDMTGLEFLKALSERVRELPCPIIVFNGQGNENVSTECMKYGAYDYLVKDTLTPESLQLSVQTSLQIYQRKLQEYYFRNSSILESISDAFYALDADEKFIYVNRKTEELWNMRREELLGKKIWDIFSQTIGSLSYQLLRQAITEQVTVSFEIYSNFIQRWVKVRVYPSDGGISVYFQDITAQKQAEEQMQRWNQELEMRVEKRTAALATEIAERKRTEEKLQETKELYLSLFNTIVVLHGLDGTILASNPSAERILGILTAHITGRTSFDSSWQALHEDGTPFPGETHPAMITLQTGKACREIIMGLRGSDDTMKWILINSEPLYQTDGTTLRGVVASFSDITEKYVVARAIYESEERYHSLYDNNLYGVLLAEADGSILAANPAVCQMLGYEEQEIIALGRDGVVERSAEQIQRDHEQLQIFGKIQRETVFIHKNGTRLLCEDATSIYRDKNGQEQICVVIHDISARKNAVEALRQSEERFRILAENSIDMISMLSPERVFEYISPACQRIIGFTPEELIGHHYNEHIHPDDLEALQKNRANRLEQNNKSFITCRARCKNGEYIWVENSSQAITDPVTGQLLNIISVTRDITERRKIEEALADEKLKAKNLESLGVLAGRIAHDFNNILTAILGSISLAKIQLETQEILEQTLAEAEAATFRAAGLVSQLLTFAQGGAPIREKAKLHEIILDTVQFLTGGSTTKCIFKLSPHLWMVEVDRTQLSQVLQNITLNSMYAMPKGGNINIEALNVSLDETETFDLKPGNYVHITIQDEGSGIKPEDLNRVFDPYYTTKPLGSGLGLAIAYSIIKKHGGAITIESEWGRGTRVSIYLPAVGNEEVPPPLQKQQTHSFVKGRVLLMDDEKMLLRISAKALKRIGFEVEEAADGQEALEKYREAKNRKQPFTLVILDLTIPGGMGGLETIEKLLQLDPSVKAIVSSGYSNDPVLAKYGDYGFVDVLKKPYNLATLEEVVRQVIH